MSGTNNNKIDDVSELIVKLSTSGPKMATAEQPPPPQQTALSESNQVILDPTNSPS